MLAQRLSRYSLDIFYEARSVIRLSFVTFRYMYDTCWACVEHLLIAMKPWILVDKRQTIIGTHELKVFKLLFICLRKIEIEQNIRVIMGCRRSCIQKKIYLRSVLYCPLLIQLAYIFRKYHLSVVCLLFKINQFLIFTKLGFPLLLAYSACHSLRIFLSCVSYQCCFTIISRSLLLSHFFPLILLMNHFINSYGVFLCIWTEN